MIYNLLTQQQWVQNRTLNTLNFVTLRAIFKGKMLGMLEMYERAKINLLMTRRNVHLLTLMYKRAKDAQKDQQ